MPSRLSVCTLTRDDAHHLARMIDSVAALGAEVIVADTGSSDRTVEVAFTRGARVVSVAWDDDFAAGRNAALAAADGAWALWMNPDEELLGPDAAALLALIDAAPESVAYFRALVRDTAQADRPDVYAETADVRLYRKRPGLRYLGRLHPTLDFDAVGATPEQFAPSGLIFRRHGYESTLDAGKVRWALHLLERELADRPGRLPAVIEYGRNLLLLNDPRGHDVMGQAVSALQPYVGAAAAPTPQAQVLLEYALNTPEALYKGSIAPGLAVALALKWFPESPLLWSLAQLCFRTRQFGAAAGYLERLAAMGESGRFDRSQAFDPRIIGPFAWLNLGQCRRALGDEAGARRCFEALRHDPDFAAQAEALLAAPAPPTV